MSGNVTEDYALATGIGRGALLAALVLFSGTAFTQSEFGSLPRVSAPGAYGDSVNTGGVAASSTQRALSPPPGVSSFDNGGLDYSLSLGYTQHSNPERVSTGEEEDNSFLVNGGLAWRGNLGRHQYELGANVGSERYDTFDFEDTDYRQVSAALKLDISAILVGDLWASRAEADEQPGVSSSRPTGIGEDPDRFRTDTIGGRLTLGRRSNLLQIYAGVEAYEVEYLNNNQSVRDREGTSADLGVFFNVGAATALFLHFRQGDTDYLAGNPSLDNTERSLTAGITWEASEAFSFTAEAGRLEKEYDDPGIEGYDGSTYLGKVLWRPTDRNSASLFVSRTTEESPDSSAAFYVSDLVGVDFSQQLGSRLTATVYYVVSEDEFDDGRVDDLTDYGISLGYSAFTWASIGLAYSHIERESNRAVENYEDDVLSLFLKMNGSTGD